VDGSTFNSIDATSLHILESLLKDLSDRGVRLLFALVRASVRDSLRNSGLTSKLIMDPKLQIQDAVRLLGGEV